MGFIINVLAFVVTVLIGIVTFFKWKYKHWQKIKVPFIEPTFLIGTMSNPFYNVVANGTLFRNQYEEAKRNGYKFIGLFFYSSPRLMVLDLELVKRIMTKDFAYFMDRGIYINERDEPLSTHLFSLEGDKWKNLRVKLTPTFTSSKMKMMFNVVRDCGKGLEKAIEDSVGQRDGVNIKEFLSCFGTDVIGTCAFGIECNSFKNPNSEFRKYSKMIVTPPFFKYLEGLMAFCTPDLARFLRITLFPREANDFFMTLVKDTVSHRKKNGVTRNDFLQILIDLKNSGGDKSLTIEELAAQCFIFFVAGFETSSTTMTFCLYELSQNPEVQDKIREEINSVLEETNGEITYEAIKNMNYLTQAIDETLRKYPPLPVLTRRCVADYKLPNTDVIIKKGTTVFIPIYGLQNDPEYFTEPETFEPDRFSEENKQKVIPFTYMPFGEGPRVCIGLRFGMMQARLGLVILLRKFKFSLNNKTKLPLQMDPKSRFILSALGDIWLSAEKV